MTIVSRGPVPRMLHRNIKNTASYTDKTRKWMSGVIVELNRVSFYSLNNERELRFKSVVLTTLPTFRGAGPLEGQVPGKRSHNSLGDKRSSKG
jgi:hypothetical protein